DGVAASGGYQNAGNASTRPGIRFAKDGRPDVSVEVVSVAGAGKKGAGHLEVGAGNDGDTTLITLTATGDAPVRWSATTGASWLYLSQSSGVLKPGESLTIKVYVDHLREPSGPWSARVAVSPAGAVVTIQGYGTAPAPSAPGEPTTPPSSPSPTASAPSDPPPSDPPSSSPSPTPPDPTSSDPASPTPSPTDSGDPSPSTS
ncbi:BACON domain-containing protein, partial [Streptomyces sviceus]